MKYNETNTCGCYLDSFDDKVLMQCYYNTDNLTLKTCVDTFLDSFNVGLCYLEYFPLECDSFEYDIIFYTEPILSVGNISANIQDILIVKYSSDFKTYENVSKTFVSINVYYEDLKYTLISQQPKIELFGLISNLGGILGLFIGFSFISLLEIIEVLAELVYIYLE
jgi:tetrahydromethanopterin S-methyltransferase subunit F